MVTKKICMIGAFSVGKTSLVERYVHSIFSDQYLSTVGVKISKKTLQIQNEEVSLVLWDMEGKDDFSDINLSYLRGAMGIFLVADGLRRETLDDVATLRDVVKKVAANIPQVILVNKVDLESSWEISDRDLERLKRPDTIIMKTSAKSGVGVNEAFLALAEAMLQK